MTLRRLVAGSSLLSQLTTDEIHVLVRPYLSLLALFHDI